jgi:hypothetical protein
VGGEFSQGGLDDTEGLLLVAGVQQGVVDVAAVVAFCRTP